MKWLPVTTSTALAEGSLTEFTSGLLAAADDNDTDLAGILAKAIAATDSDYASARKVPVYWPLDRNCEVEATGQSGFTASDIGGEYGISSSTLLDQTDTTNKVFKVFDVADSGATVRGKLKINGVY